MGVFHEGEREAQRRAGVEHMAARVGNGIHNVIPDAARDFLEQQPFAVIGASDAGGHVWATILVGKPGFLQATEDASMEIFADVSARDPLADVFARATRSEPLAVGLLAIEPQTRRRMRLNGNWFRVADGLFQLNAREVYANCPKYIQKREPQDVAIEDSLIKPEAAQIGQRLSTGQIKQIRRADTFFIATRHKEAGADASHRGGLPGFVQVSDDGQTLTWPDYSGNAMFNTLGNIVSDPCAGLVFVDADESGDVLHLSGQASILWKGEEVARFPGAERLVRFSVESVVARAGAFPLRYQFVDYSRFNPQG